MPAPNMRAARPLQPPEGVTLAPTEAAAASALDAPPSRSSARNESKASLLGTSWVRYPSHGPPVSTLSAFLSYAKRLDGESFFLDPASLEPVVRSAIGLMAGSAGSVATHAIVSANNDDTDFFKAPNPALSVDEIEGSVCKYYPWMGQEDGSGRIYPNVVILVCTAVLIFVDLTDGFYLPALRPFSKPRQHSEPAAAASISTTGSVSTADTPHTGTTAPPEQKADAAPIGKGSEANSEAKAAEAEEDGSPKSIDLAGMLIIAFTIIPAFVGDLYFTMLAPFLPGVTDQRGIGPAFTGLIFACQPLGSLFTAPIMPWALRQSWGDPYLMIRTSTAVMVLAVSIAGIAGRIPLWDPTTTNAVLFTAVLCATRVVQGVCVTVMEVCNESISLMLLPKDKVGPVGGVTMAIRILGVIAGPVLGGFLYQEGCWSLPFAVGGGLLFLSVLAQMAGLGRRAPKKLRSTRSEMTTWQLLAIPDSWFLALPMIVVCMETSLLEPAWQGFLGRDPFRLPPAGIGAFLNYAVLVYMLMLIIGGMLVGYLGPAIQYMAGAILSGCGMFFIGPSPIFGGFFPQTEWTVLVGTMVNYTGVALFVPAMLPLGLEIYERAGFSQKQVAGVSSAMFTLVICSANFVGPPLGGLLIDHLGSVPKTTTVYGVGVITITVLASVRLCAYAKRIDKDIAKAFSSADALESAEAAPEKEAKSA